MKWNTGIVNVYDRIVWFFLTERIDLSNFVRYWNSKNLQLLWEFFLIRTLLTDASHRRDNMTRLALAAVPALETLSAWAFPSERITKTAGRAPRIAVTRHTRNPSTRISVIALVTGLTFFPDEPVLASIADEISDVIVMDNGAGLAVTVFDRGTSAAPASVAGSLMRVPVEALRAPLTTLTWK